MKDFAKSIRTNNADLSLRPVVPQMVKDVAKLYEDNGKDREKTKQDLVRKLHIDETKADEILRKIVGNSKVGNYMMNPSGQVEDLIKSSEKYIASGDKEGAKRLFGSMEIVFRQLKEDKEEHYKKYQEADDLLGKLNKAAGKLKSIL